MNVKARRGTRRMSRLVRWLAGRNALRRPVDRIEGAFLVVLSAAFLVVMTVASILAAHTYQSQMDHVLCMQALATHWGELPSREQKILLMRFYGGMTQDQIGQRLGISQMQVSRLLGHALRYLRPRLLGFDERATAASGA